LGFFAIMVSAGCWLPCDCGHRPVEPTLIGLN
jgi:hypothetical protein